MKWLLPLALPRMMRLLFDDSACGERARIFSRAHDFMTTVFLRILKFNQVFIRYHRQILRLCLWWSNEWTALIILLLLQTMQSPVWTTTIGRLARHTSSYPSICYGRWLIIRGKAFDIFFNCFVTTIRFLQVGVMELLMSNIRRSIHSLYTIFSFFFW